VSLCGYNSTIFVLTITTANFFNDELTQLLGRNLKVWNEEDLDICLNEAPRNSVVQLLQAYIGEHV
jgi:hypothetical protein